MISFDELAKGRSVAPSTVWRQLKLLGLALGVELFSGTGRSQPTGKARELAKIVERLLADLE
jgi:DNA-binding transcriptional LysR family regulator